MNWLRRCAPGLLAASACAVVVPSVMAAPSIGPAHAVMPTEPGPGEQPGRPLAIVPLGDGLLAIVLQQQFGRDYDLLARRLDADFTPVGDWSVLLSGIESITLTFGAASFGDGALVVVQTDGPPLTAVIDAVDPIPALAPTLLTPLGGGTRPFMQCDAAAQRCLLVALSRAVVFDTSGAVLTDVPLDSSTPIVSRRMDDHWLVLARRALPNTNQLHLLEIFDDGTVVPGASLALNVDSPRGIWTGTEYWVQGTPCPIHRLSASLTVLGSTPSTCGRFLELDDGEPGLLWMTGNGPLLQALDASAELTGPVLEIPLPPNANGNAGLGSVSADLALTSLVRNGEWIGFFRAQGSYHGPYHNSFVGRRPLDAASEGTASWLFSGRLEAVSWQAVPTSTGWLVVWSDELYENRVRLRPLDPDGAPSGPMVELPTSGPMGLSGSTPRARVTRAGSTIFVSTGETLVEVSPEGAPTGSTIDVGSTILQLAGAPDRVAVLSSSPGTLRLEQFSLTSDLLSSVEGYLDDLVWSGVGFIGGGSLLSTDGTLSTIARSSERPELWACRPDIDCVRRDWIHEGGLTFHASHHLFLPDGTPVQHYAGTSYQPTIPTSVNRSRIFGTDGLAYAEVRSDRNTAERELIYHAPWESEQLEPAAFGYDQLFVWYQRDANRGEEVVGDGEGHLLLVHPVDGVLVARVATSLYRSLPPREGEDETGGEDDTGGEDETGGDTGGTDDTGGAGETGTATSPTTTSPGPATGGETGADTDGDSTPPSGTDGDGGCSCTTTRSRWDVSSCLALLGLVAAGRRRLRPRV